MTQKPQILHKEIVATSQLFRIEAVNLRFSNGEERRFERLSGQRSKRAVMVIPLLDDDTILLIREYGVGLEDYHISFPKGTVDDGEELLAAANRELQEEVGYAAEEFIPLKSLSNSPAYSTRVMDLLIARQLTPQRLPGDEPEPLEVVPWRLSDIDSLLIRPDFHEVRSLAALFLVRDWLNEQ